MSELIISQIEGFLIKNEENYEYLSDTLGHNECFLHRYSENEGGSGFLKFKVNFTVLKTHFNDSDSKYSEYSEFFKTEDLVKPEKSSLKKILLEYGIRKEEITGIIDIIMDEETSYGCFFVTEKTLIK